VEYGSSQRPNTPIRLNCERCRSRNFSAKPAAGVTNLHRVHLKLLAAEGFVNLDFDWETVAIPAWNVGRVEASHVLGLHDEVLKRLVHGGAEVDGAVGVGADHHAVHTSATPARLLRMRS